MKRIWLGIALLAVFLVLGMWSSRLVDTLHTPLAQQLEQAAQAALEGDLSVGIALAEEAETLWQTQWNKTALLADHGPMDEIDALFARLKTYADAGLAADFASLCSQVATLIEAVADAHRFAWWNLF